MHETVRSGRQPGEDGIRRWLSPKVIIGLVIVAVAMTFVFQNTESGRIHFLLWDLELPAWLWLLILFLAGLAVGSLLPWFRRRRAN
jgi:uncharacterized integral membrane protein